MRSTILIISLAVQVAIASPVQVAVVSSKSQFQLREAQIKPGQGVPSWPVLDGDKVASGNEPVLFTFADGSTIVLYPHSNAKAEMTNGVPVFRLLCGSASYSLKTIPAVTLMAHDKIVTPPEVRGMYNIVGGCDIGGGFWTAPRTALILGAAAGLGIGLGIAQSTQGSVPLSPSR